MDTGAGESGKSTILKQMKLIYSQGFSRTEKLEWKPVIFSNIVQSLKTINDAMIEMKIDFEKSENEVRLTLPAYTRQPLSRDIPGPGVTMIGMYPKLLIHCAVLRSACC